MIAEIYTREDCVFCVKAKELLKTHDIPYIESVVGKDVTREHVLSRLKKDFDSKVLLPVIFIDGEWIGGHEELLRMVAEEVFK